MAIDDASGDSAFLTEVERQLGRRLQDHEARLASDLRKDKTVPMIVRELEGAVIADPKKIRPEHKDAADE